MEHGAEILQKYFLASTKFVFFFAIAQKLWFVW